MSARMTTLKKNVMAVKFGGIRQLHGLLANLLKEWLLQAKIPHTGGVGSYKRTCKGLFTDLADQLPELNPNKPAHATALRHRQGITPCSHDCSRVDRPPRKCS